MQVSHVQDHATHAVITANETMSMGVSDDPALMMVLSSLLYKDQKQALVREVLCNGWDAHIAAGITDKPLVVTLTSDKLTFRDFGPGIPPELMGPLYGTYGGTNKKNDGNQTGGFGLGCKSPFSYVDLFQTKMMHNGTCTLYSHSKSSAEKQGKPGITKIVDFPTTETGVEVSLAVKPGDRQRFHELITRLAANGEIKVELNGTLLDVLPFSEMEDNWLITIKKVWDHDNYSIFIRYGNVIYPLDSEPKYKTNYDQILTFVKALHAGYRYNGTDGYKIIFQAQPDTISVQPSREGLAMVEQTINTVSDLLADFMPTMKRGLKKEVFKLLEKEVEAAKVDESLSFLLSDRPEIYSYKSTFRTITNREFIYSVETTAEQYINKGYPESLDGLYEKDIVKRIDAALEIGVNRKGHLRQLRFLIQKPVPTTKAIRRMGRSNQYRYEGPAALAWFRHRIVKPFAKDFMGHEFLKLENLFIHTNPGNDKYCLTEIKKYKEYTFRNILPFLRDVVVLTHSQTKLSEKINQFPEMKKLGSSEKFFVYKTPYAKKGLQEMRDYFTSKGYTLLDLTVPHDWDAPKEKRVINRDPVVKKPKLEGWPAASGAQRPGYSSRIDNCWRDDCPRVVNPIAYVKELPSRSEHRRFELGTFQGTAAYNILKLWGDKIAVAKSDPQEQKLKDAGVPELSLFARDYIWDRITNSPEFIAYWPTDPGRVLGALEGTGMPASANSDEGRLRVLLSIKIIRDSIGLGPMLSPEDLLIKELWTETAYRGAYAYMTPDGNVKQSDTRAAIEAFPIDPNVLKLLEFVKASNLLKILDMSEIETKIKSMTPEQEEALVEIISLALTA